mmetsp:Transcript_92659/g.155522  ORF Transcript_92659/g.155522 Transcript_92659/m.155522 type:complete len:168 (+) Transcript_92659:74-577(+)
MPSGVTHTQGCLLLSIVFVHWQVELKISACTFSLHAIHPLSRRLRLRGLHRRHSQLLGEDFAEVSRSIFFPICNPNASDSRAACSLLVHGWCMGPDNFASFCIFSTPHFECDLQSFPKDSQPLSQCQWQEQWELKHELMVSQPMCIYGVYLCVCVCVCVFLRNVCCT